VAAVAKTERFEIDLTPLLDVVLQLIMFFLMCVHFVSDEFDPNVVLAESAAANPQIEAITSDRLVINIEVIREDEKDAQGNLVYDKQTLRPKRIPISPRVTKVTFIPYKTKVAELLGPEQRKQLQPPPLFIADESDPAKLAALRDRLIKDGVMNRSEANKPFAVLPEANGIEAAKAVMSSLRRAIAVDKSKVIQHPDGRIEMKIPVILRADRESDWGLVVSLVAQCVREGFPEIEASAYMLEKPKGQ
jgi:biopolymer transport protein ExbD